MTTSSMSSSSWTDQQNKVFEKALADYNQNTPDFWHKVARRVGGKSVDEVKRHYQLLVNDIHRIERGQMPQAKYHFLANRGTSFLFLPVFSFYYKYSLIPVK
ncbi:hypothetical protein Cni_G19731 [Canna indica]|uniref:Myb-like domain-containing protein n=1 Tax=Canna indica TaxID=4628 RepID=A0AAQ3QFI4_9LILI|nr:hypothetical protein Cni_G19731 [Canna indica]